MQAVLAILAVLSLPSDSAADAMARAVLAKMTLEEKVSLTGGCATMYLNAIPRVGISNESAFSDCSHAIKPEHRRDGWGYVDGVDDRSTALAPLSAVASTWNRELAALHGDVMGEQMRARGKDMMLGPGVNIMRSPLCGRNWEYMSEDPCLVAKLVVPLVKSVQRHGVAATVKHFCLNGQELARNSVDTVVDERTLHEIYLPAFRAAIVEGGALGVMTAYNKVDGVYCSENAYLQRDILRRRWGFNGMIVTDWGGQHSTVAAALNGGNVEMNCGSEIVHFTNFHAKPGESRFPLADAVRRGEVPAATVDEMVYHVLWTMAKTGFLSGNREKGERLTARHQTAARAIGEEAVTLLKNADGVLPLDRAKTKRLVVIGNQADVKVAHLGSSCESHPLYEVTPLAGLRAYLGDTVEILPFPLGGEAGGEKTQPIDNLLLETFDRNGGAAYVVRAWEEERWKKRYCVGPADARGFAKYPKYDSSAADPEVGSYRWTAKVRAPETGKYLLVAEQNGASVTGLRVNETELQAWCAGKVACEIALEKDRVYEVRIDYTPENKPADLLFGWIPPSARISKAEIRAAAEKADAVLVFTGTVMGYGRAKECEGGDRPDMKGPVGHDEAIDEILSWKLPRIVVLNRSGSPMEMPWEPNCRTFLQLPYLGQEAGRVVARVLFGETNPSGRLPCTWPRRYADTPVAMVGTYNDKQVVYNEGLFVGYRWHDEKRIAPMFPFGYGLSYTRFDYGECRVTQENGGWNVSVDVRNAGLADGKETVQLYVRAVDPKVRQVPKQLKDFDKISVRRGQTATARLSVTPRDLAYYDVGSHRWRTDVGRYEILIGASATDIRRTCEIVFEKEKMFDE